MSIRLDSFSFEEFVEFVFDPTTEPSLFIDETYFYGNRRFTLEYLTRLFQQPEFLFHRFTEQRLEQGLSNIIPYMLCEVAFFGLLWEKSIPLSLRQQCIFAMFDLFSRFFVVNPLEGACFMWWDRIAYGYFMENGLANDTDGIEIQQAMFETLKRILEIDSEDCQKSALHGLGHLKHYHTEQAIQDFLALHSVSQRLKNCAHACIEGTMDRKSY